MIALTTSRKYLQPVISFLAVMVLSTAFVPTARAADRDKLEAFLEVTGFGVALDSIALSAADAPTMLGLSASDFGSDWSRVADEVFDTESMRGTALDILEQTLDDELLSHAAEFYASSLGQRLVAAENDSHMNPDDAAKQETGRELVSKSVQSGAKRLEYLNRMNAAVDTGDMAIRAVTEIQVRFLMAASAAGVLEQRIDEGSLRAAIAGREDQMRRTLQMSALAGAAYAYRDFEDGELLAYAEALEHPKMRQVYELMNAVQYEIMANRFEVLAERMATLHPEQEL